jgi:hypothetical protein
MINGIMIMTMIGMMTMTIPVLLPDWQQRHSKGFVFKAEGHGFQP